MSRLKVYEYENCDTCRKALKFLEKKKIAFEAIPIVDQPPSKRELKTMLEHVGGDLKRLFNTSGQLYREMEIGKKLGEMTEAEALELLSRNGKLIKRPFVLSEQPALGLIGFREPEWTKALAARGGR